MRPIVTIPDPALRTVCTPVAADEFGTPTFTKLLAELSESLASRSDGVGLSAPQIGITTRIFVVAGKIFDKAWQNDEPTDPKKVFKDEYFINPVVVKTSKKLATAEEGCLSIPNTYGMVKRPVNITIEYYDETGSKKSRGTSGLLARIFQHEIDHLDGILFTDKATDVKQMKDDASNTEY